MVLQNTRIALSIAFTTLAAATFANAQVVINEFMADNSSPTSTILDEDGDKEDWIEAYNFITPEVRKVNPIGKYLQGKENHKYDNPVIEKVVAKDEAKGEATVACPGCGKQVSAETVRHSHKPGTAEAAPANGNSRIAEIAQYEVEQRLSNRRLRGSRAGSLESKGSRRALFYVPKP